MALISRDQIKAADDRRWQDVEVPEWGGSVRLLALSGADREAYERLALVTAPNGAQTRRMPEHARARLLAKCLVNEDFSRMYQDKEAPELSAKDGKVLDRLFDIAATLSGLDKGAVEKKKGNSAAAQSGASSSD